jgi:hypothetical protein
MIKNNGLQCSEGSFGFGSTSVGSYCVSFNKVELLLSISMDRNDPLKNQVLYFEQR